MRFFVSFLKKIFILNILGGSYHIVHGELVMTDEEEEKVFEHKGGDAKLKDNVFRDGLLDESKRWPMPIHYTIDSNLSKYKLY